jgi:exopolyphosphatase/guanosine-5'-triphosphate,3'-diphosphate pyrophosphatase
MLALLSYTMRLAIIDLGTNSVRFDVVEVGENGEVIKLHREKLMIRLGERVFLRRRLDRHASEVCLEAFSSFQKTLKEFHVRRVVAFGTSALREARDGERLIEKIKKKTGITLRIISGDEEARLIARGILKYEKSLLGKFALIDIGGGSTEVSICSGRKVLRGASFPLGTARLQQVFLKSIPPNLDENGKGTSLDQLRRHVRGILLYRLVSEEWPKVSRILGSSGTIRALTRISKKETGSPIIERNYLDDLVKRMLKMSRDGLLQVSGMESRRVDMILSGAILLQECMNAVHANRVELTEYSLRDGILDEQVEILLASKANDAPHLIHDFFVRATELGENGSELRQSIKIAEDLFDLLKPIHSLDNEWRTYLVLATILCRAGRAVSSIRYEFHSSYLANFVDIVALRDWERKLLAELCMRHKGGRFLKRDVAFKKTERLHKIFYKLLALLRITAAFSLQRSKPIVFEKVSFKNGVVRLTVSKRYAPDLEILRADQKKHLFEEVFRKRLLIEVGGRAL